MCGIVGYTGYDEAASILIDGLKRLEYRGYDSAGIAVSKDNIIKISKSVGKVDNLAAKVSESDISGLCGVGHTRWATHGVPSDVNSHPHMSGDSKFALVHNGIIENFAELKKHLLEKGFEFKSETDTEVIVQLLSLNYEGDILKAVLKTLSQLEGSYALGILCSDEPGVIYTAKKSSPLIIGLGENENLFASDITALIDHTKTVVDLEDNEVAIVSKDNVLFFDNTGKQIEKTSRTVDWDISNAEKGGFDHFMLKEIYEQPKALKATIEPRVKYNKVYFDGLNIDLCNINHILITACGSAFYAGCVGKNLIERLCRIPVTAEVASELRYSDPIIDEHTLVIAISQSGETADSIAAIKECQSKGAKVLSIVNVVGSSIAKLADYCIYTWAGPEIAVATTKGYTTQVSILYLFAAWAGYSLGKISALEYMRLIEDILKLPELAQKVLDMNPNIEDFAKKYYTQDNIFFIGRNLDYSVSLEGSLKLKEISYIHSDAYAAGELKHGTIALIEDERLVIALCCYEELLDKTISNIQQVKARGARVLAVTTEGNEKVKAEADDVIYIPAMNKLLFPVIEVIPLQLFAYYVAKANGCDIDKPKNLAKSVTVE